MMDCADITVSDDAVGWIDHSLLLRLKIFNGIMFEDAVDGFDGMLSMLVNFMLDCSYIMVSHDAGRWIDCYCY